MWVRPKDLSWFLLLASVILPLFSADQSKEPPLSSPSSTETDYIQSLSSLRANAPAALASGDVAHLVKLASVYAQLNMYNHASFVCISALNVLESQPTLDPEKVHMIALAEMGNMLNEKRMLAGTTYLDFKHPAGPASPTSQEPVPLAVPYYLCLEKMIPMFLVEGDSCVKLFPFVVIAMVDNTSDYDFLNKVVTAICSDTLGFEESTKAALGTCKAYVTQAMANEIYSTNKENGANGKNAWKRGDFPLDWGFKETMDALDKVAVKSPGQMLEGNLWHQNGWSKVDGREIGYDGEPVITNDELPTTVAGNHENNSTKKGYNEGLVRAIKRRALLTLVSVSLQNGEGKYLEVGFNAGHSAGMVLETFPGVNVTSFDICARAYTLPAYEKLKKMYSKDSSKKLELICGNSVETMPKFASDSIEEGRFDVQQGYDVVFIDAGHLYFFAWNDILNAAPFAKPGSIVIVDDCSTDLYNRADGQLLTECDKYKFHVGLAFRHAVAMGIVEPLSGDVNGDASFCVGRYRMHQVEKYRNGFPLAP
ncbi:hypothetical protein TrCOL_g8517 [Triparma columacea]|uniref:Uncharacterized protein n=1 Tax=Triparma columacea TaxID=722753 RepID=A0A9W7L251_9STRA|nr:hypothetical protein TrCOL_g8517 [Triparma columacea]